MKTKVLGSISIFKSEIDKVHVRLKKLEELLQSYINMVTRILG
jgi:hypothetical protein